MKNRQTRLNCLRDIVQNGNIRTQEMLLKELHSRGYLITQATLSRDLRTLKVGKISYEDQGYTYVFLEEKKELPEEEDYLHDIQRGFITYDFSGSICVVHTLPGHGNSVALAIDKISFTEVLGTIAGDDTIFILLKEGAVRENIHAFFQNTILTAEEKP